MQIAASAGSIVYISLEGGTVAVLKVDDHYEIVSESEISGSIEVLCSLATGQRVILSHDLSRSYRVEGKARAGDQVVVKVRRALPISNEEPIRTLLEDNEHA